ncbi:MAG: hypothetical protein NTY04_01245, partial [Candidatus Staskawiczbacteria bacterium]|nr:hypothetical protein [Candidatus Staskawiczbacteria bacterium]
MDPNTSQIYSDYEKIIPHEKLSQFLFNDILAFEKLSWVKDIGEESFCQVFQSIIQKHNRFRLPFVFLDKFFLKLYIKKNKKNKKNILFQSSKYLDVILEVKKYYNVGLIINGKKERLFTAKNFVGYVGVDDLAQYVLNYLKEKNVKYLYQLIKEIEDKLTAVKPDYIVLWNDAQPVERAIVLVSKKLGITTIEVQHGIYLPPVLPFTTGRVVDYVLVWGQYFKDLYVKQNIRKPEDIYVLGYPYLVKKEKFIENENKKYTICCLGEAFERFDKNFLPITLSNINSLSEMCKKLGFKFIYRPHPGDYRELLKKNLTDVQFTDIGEKLKETFRRADIFISFASTASVEAAMNGKISLQLMNYPLKLDNFEKLGICDKSFENII